jgi:hypothetical protein
LLYYQCGPWCFLLWVFSALLVLSDASSFFCFVGALYVAWVLFYVGLFSVRTFLFSVGLLLFLNRKTGRPRNCQMGEFASETPRNPLKTPQVQNNLIPTLQHDHMLERCRNRTAHLNPPLARTLLDGVFLSLKPLYLVISPLLNRMMPQQQVGSVPAPHYHIWSGWTLKHCLWVYWCGPVVETLVFSHDFIVLLRAL